MFDLFSFGLSHRVRCRTHKIKIWLLQSVATRIPDECQCTVFILEWLLWLIFLILYLEKELNIRFRDLGINFVSANF